MRFTNVDENNMLADIELIDEDGNDRIERVSVVFEVCDRCYGRGTHVDEAIDGNGITQSEWAEWDGDEREAYFNGSYDVTCTRCRGKRVMLVLNVADLSDELRADICDVFEDDVDTVDRIRACELRHGC